MANYQVLARKYRPQKFGQVVGQEAIVSTLKNAIAMDRTAHAYLFCGCRGTGKTTLARLFAKALNCSAPTPDGEPCGTCSSCREIAAGHAIDVLEIDGASHRGIEDIRQINETIGFTPTGGKYKIYLIDEVHMLTKEAFNALLKTLEEPPAHAKFFFATTEVHKIPATILSRCQRFNLNRIPLEKMCPKLEQIAADLELEVEEEALIALAELSEGSLRDAQSLFDQVIAYQQTPITAEVVANVLGLPSRTLFFKLDEAGANKEFAAAFKIAEEVFSTGKNIAFFLEELVHHFRTLFLLKSGVPFRGRDEKKYARSVTFYRHDQLMTILEMVSEAMQSVKFATSERTAVEMLLLKILRSHQRISIDQLVEKLQALEGRLQQQPAPKQEEAPKPVKKSETPKAKPKPQKPATPKVAVAVKSQSHHDTLMRFAAKELNGAFKKE